MRQSFARVPVKIDLAGSTGGAATLFQSG